MAAFQPIPAFNGALQFPTAYSWDSSKILSFLEVVAANPAAYGAPPGHEADLKLLCNNINELGTRGSRYKKPRPEQQFLRKGDPLEVDSTNPIRWTVNNIAERYFIIFDLLGMFLSLMGPAPANATSKNFFLPLVVVYARWCCALARGDNPKPPVRPTITQITWASNDNGRTWYYFLGASSAGFNKNPRTYKELVGRTRHGYLQSILRAPWLEFGKSPLKDNNGNAGTNFGNCGETYPFLYTLGDPTLKNNTFGIAFHVGNATNNKYNGQDYWNEVAIRSPCENCQQLMDWYGVGDRVKHFELWKP